MNRPIRRAAGFFAWFAIALIAERCMFCAGGTLRAAEHTVQNAQELRAALSSLEHGDTVKIAPGTYPGGNHVNGVAKLTVEALDPENPPVFEGGLTGWQFSECPDLTLRYLQVRGQTSNGLNLDNGSAEQPLVEGVRIEHVQVSDIGPDGNYDGIKMSGLRGTVIRDCLVTGWGGQAIDMVGCHNLRIVYCRFVGKEGYRPSAGVQAKGGSSGVTVENCRFENAGERPLNIGGSTDLPFFRPLDAKHEAKDITVRGNHIEGGLCAAAFVGVDGAVFENNTVLFPTRWLFRILQENRSEGFVPSRNGVVRGNRIIFRRGDIREDVNTSDDGIAPETFRFENNRWFAEDRPDASRPKLPVEETGGEYGTDPRS
ncbi:MAG: right-handed parallel beta-helix repeat-containing protein [Pirellulales bacterium]